MESDGTIVVFVFATVFQVALPKDMSIFATLTTIAYQRLEIEKSFYDSFDRPHRSLQNGVICCPSKKAWKCYHTYLRSYRHLKFQRYSFVWGGLGENFNSIYWYENAGELKQLCENG